MSSVTIAAIVFACVSGGALLGMALPAILPGHHLNPDSKDAVKLGMGLVATMAALVLSLLTGSAKTSFDTQDAEVKQNAADTITLDRVLAHYGSDTRELRDAIRRAVASRLAELWPESGPRPDTATVAAAIPAFESIERGIRALTPENDDQRALKARALGLIEEVIHRQWLLFEQADTALQTPLLVVMVFWLTALFASFGLFSPRNATVIAVLCVSALSVSGAVFLILEMNRPLAGMMKLSSAPLRHTLSQLDR